MTTATIPLTDVGSQGNDRVILGVNLEGRPLVIDRTWRPMLLVSGESGSGKGGAVRVMQHHDFTVGNQVIILQPKAGEFGWTAGAASLVSTAEGFTKALRWVAKEMDRRQQVLATTPNKATGTLGIDKFDDLDEPWPRVIVYLDEFPGIAGTEALIDVTREEVLERSSYIAAIVKRGRSAGVNAVIITQRPTIAGTFGFNGEIGGGIFASTTQRLHFDRETESLKAAFNHCGPGSPAVLKAITENLPGRVAYAYAEASDGGKVMAGQVMWLTQQQARAAAANYTGPAPMDFDQ